MSAGYSDIRKGEPGYSSKLDRDGDGIACIDNRRKSLIILNG
nr:excalibur calcium-binding domain-containing protein [Lysinibacillus fusiformis]